MIDGIDARDLGDTWTPCSPGLEIELKRELSEGHVLFGIEARSVARRTDNDDVLFALRDFDKPLAVVHLTWSGQPDADPSFPFTRFYDSVEHLVASEAVADRSAQD